MAAVVAMREAAAAAAAAAAQVAASTLAAMSVSAVESGSDAITHAVHAFVAAVAGESDLFVAHAAVVNDPDAPTAAEGVSLAPADAPAAGDVAAAAAFAGVPPPLPRFPSPSPSPPPPPPAAFPTVSLWWIASFGGYFLRGC